MAEKMTQAEVTEWLAQELDWEKSDVRKFYNAAVKLIEQQLKKAGTVTLPIGVKLTLVKKKATKERKGINPFTKEPCVFKAKPARKVIKIKPMKKLKDLV